MDKRFLYQVGEGELPKLSGYSPRRPPSQEGEARAPSYRRRKEEGVSYIEVASIDRSTGGYEFDELRVVRSKETGNLFYATDSGCSCPTPFEAEDADFPAAWTPIKKGESWRAFVAAVDSWNGKHLGTKEISDFTEKVKAALNTKPTPTAPR
jgi:hypothetical protein